MYKVTNMQFSNLDSIVFYKVMSALNQLGLYFNPN